MPPQAFEYSRVLGFAQHWIGKLLLLAVISLFLFHAVHRIYHGLHDLGVHAGTGAMVAAYGSALAGTLIAAYLLIAVGF
jgi:fumarate reductase subunit D